MLPEDLTQMEQMQALAALGESDEELNGPEVFASLEALRIIPEGLGQLLL